MDNDMIKNISDKEALKTVEEEAVKEDSKPVRKRNNAKSAKQQSEKVEIGQESEKVETVDFKHTEEPSTMKNIVYPTPVYLAASNRSPIIGITSGKCKVICTKGEWINVKVGIPGKGAIVGYVKKSCTCIRSI